MDRRTFLKSATATVGAVMAATSVYSETTKLYQGGKSPWPLCMNTSTIRPASILEKLEACKAAGYDMLELWTQDIEEYVRDVGAAKELGDRVRDMGMSVINVIGLWVNENWEVEQIA